MGVVAACGLVSLEDWQEHLQRDHDNAIFIAEELKKVSAISVDVKNI